MKLSYNKVFDRYTMSFSDKLAEFSYSLYRTLRLQLAKIFPLSEYEKYRFDDDLFSKEEAADMPQGFDYILYRQGVLKVYLKESKKQKCKLIIS